MMSVRTKEFIKRVVPPSWLPLIDRLRRRELGLRWDLSTGIKITVATKADWIIYNDIFVDGEYDAAILECLRAQDAREGLHVLDLGANVGYFSLRFIDLLRRNHCEQLAVGITLVEGSPAVAAELRQRLAAAGDFEQQLTVINGLIGKRAGTARIREGLFHPMNTIMRGGAGGVEVPYVDLEQVLGGTDEPISLLKCDIEGAELQFLENYPSLLKRVTAAVFELHPKLCDEDRCVQLLKEAGFQQSKVLRRTEDFAVVYFWR